MKKLILLIPFLMLAGPGIAQDTIGKKPDYHISMGSSFTSAGRYGSGFSSWISPEVSYQPWKRFSIQAGITIMNTTFSGYRPVWGTENGSAAGGNYSCSLLYATGSYLLNKRTIISGSLYKSFPLGASSPGNPYGSGEFQGGSLDIKYKVGEHLQIEAGFRIDRSDRPLYYDPFSFPGTSFPASPIR